MHIGTEKTGSSAIQSFLRRKRDEIAALGFCYPDLPGDFSPLAGHMALAAYCAPENLEADVANANTGLGAPEVARALAEEMACLPARLHTVIFSSEHCHSRLPREAHVARLRALLAPHFGKITVLVYLRRQDEMACSLYSSRLRGGDPCPDILPHIPAAAGKEAPDDLSWAHYFDYWNLLDRYARVFGEAAVKPRIYEQSALRGGDVVADFLAACGLPASLRGGAERVHGALPADGQSFLALLNAHQAAEAGERDWQTATELRETCARLAAHCLSGPPRLPTRDQALCFQAQFAEMNERVRARWFPERAVLFTEDFQRYPEADNEPGLQDAAMRAAFRIISALIQERKEVEAAFRASASWRLTAPLRAASLALARRSERG